ncbi:MAG: ISAs1 family transposase [Gammaproteobacteria bacterium]|nr:ISAs1 family transposase [Gammaproteobacteria bacterium]
MSLTIIEHFSVLKDPRKIKVTYPLINIIFITVCAIIAGAENFFDIVDYAELKKEWLKKYLDLSEGIPSHDTFHRVFSLLDNQLFTELFIEFTRQISQELRGVIGLDGKTMRGTKGHTPHSAIHILNAYCVENQLCIGQMPMLEKSNEITAAPLLLDKLDIEGGIVTSDALLCQQTIATKIIEKKADYLLALKDNQSSLLEDVTLYFNEQDKKSAAWDDTLNHVETIEKGHGRVETRNYYGIDTTNWGMSPKWRELNSIIRVRSIRYIKGIEVHETRYYISSLRLQQFKKAAHAVRQHWCIENNLHWQLDVSFNEDGWSGKAGNIAANIALINKLALNLVKKETSRKSSLRRKRFSTALSDDYMEKVIFNYANCIR